MQKVTIFEALLDTLSFIVTFCTIYGSYLLLFIAL